MQVTNHLNGQSSLSIANRNKCIQQPGNCGVSIYNLNGLVITPN
ncbi:MAG: hypothetical protein ACI8VW_001291, partial [bacterium]